MARQSREKVQMVVKPEDLPLVMADILKQGGQILSQEVALTCLLPPKRRGFKTTFYAQSWKHLTGR